MPAPNPFLPPPPPPPTHTHHPTPTPPPPHPTPPTHPPTHPPPMRQDIVVEPSPLQRELYQEFQNSQVRGNPCNRAPLLILRRAMAPCIAAAHALAAPAPSSLPHTPSLRTGAGPNQWAGVGRRAGGRRGRRRAPPRLPVAALPAQAVQPPAAGAGSGGLRAHAGGWVGRGRAREGGREDEKRCLGDAWHACPLAVCGAPQPPQTNCPSTCPPPPPSSQAVRKVLGPKQGADWASAQAALRSQLVHAPKLAALKELLLDAGRTRERRCAFGVQRGTWCRCLFRTLLRPRAPVVLPAPACPADGPTLVVQPSSYNLSSQPFRARLPPAPCAAPPAGIGTEPGIKREEEGGEGGGADAGHRVLIFAQLKGLLDLVESEVLAPLRVASLRIDGSVEAGERFRRRVLHGALLFWGGVLRGMLRVLWVGGAARVGHREVLAGASRAALQAQEGEGWRTGVSDATMSCSSTPSAGLPCDFPRPLLPPSFRSVLQGAALQRRPHHRRHAADHGGGRPGPQPHHSRHGGCAGGRRGGAPCREGGPRQSARSAAPRAPGPGPSAGTVCWCVEGTTSTPAPPPPPPPPCRSSSLSTTGTPWRTCRPWTGHTAWARGAPSTCIACWWVHSCCTAACTMAGALLQLQLPRCPAAAGLLACSLCRRVLAHACWPCFHLLHVRGSAPSRSRTWQTCRLQPSLPAVNHPFPHVFSSPHPPHPPPPHHTTPHHTTPHHTTPHHTTPHRTAPHRTAPHRTAPHRTAPHRTAPHRTAPHRTAPHRTAPHRTAPHRTAPHRTAPHRTAPHRTAPHRTAPTPHPHHTPTPTCRCAARWRSRS